MSIQKNSLYNLTGAIFSVVVSLLFLPMYIEIIGEERFGILSIVWLMLGYFGLFDLGLTQAVSQQMARMKDAAPQERAEMFWTVVSLNSGFGILGGLLLWPIAYLFFGRYMQVNEEVRMEIMSSLPWFIAAVPIATVSGVLAGALQGRERFLELNLINTVGITLFQALPLCFAWLFGATLQILIPSALFARIVIMIWLARDAKNCIPLIGLPSIDTSLLMPLFRFGGWVTISGVISPMMATFDRLLIGVLVGARGVTLYTVPFNLVNRVLILSTSITSAVYPRLAASSENERQRISDEVLRVLVAVTTPITVVGMLVIEPFMEWWLNAQFAVDAAPIGKIILLGLWANSSARVAYTVLQTGGRPDLVAKTHIAEIVPYGILLFLGLTQFGIMGAAIVWSMRAIFDAAILIWLAGVRANKFQIFFVPGSILIISLLFSSFIEKNSHIEWGVLCGLLLMSIVWAIFIVPNSLKLLMKKLIFKNLL